MRLAVVIEAKGKTRDLFRKHIQNTSSLNHLDMP